MPYTGLGRALSQSGLSATSHPLPPTNPVTPYLRAKEAAAYLHLSPGTLADWRVKGFGPQFGKIGRVVVYRLSDLDAYVEASLVHSTSQSTLQGIR